MDLLIQAAPAVGYDSDEEKGKRRKARGWAPKRARCRPTPAKAKTLVDTFICLYFGPT